jgi:hypothetical protein
MALSTPQNFIRRGGSAFTIFTFGGQPIAFCQEVAHTAPRPVGQGASAIQPMDEPYPIEILTPAAAGMGQITLNLFELFGSGGKASKIWDRLGMGPNTLGGNPFGAIGSNQGQSDTSQFLNLSSGGGFLQGAVDIVDIFIRQAAQQPQATTVVQIIRPPQLPSGNGGPYYIQYAGCVITDVQDGEQVNVGTLEIIKQLTIAYRYQLRDGVPSAAFSQRDARLSTGGTIGLG